MSEIIINYNIKFSDVEINDNDTSITNNVKKEGLTLYELKNIINAYEGTELTKEICSINSFSINWNGAKLSYIPDKTIYSTADLLSILDSTYFMTYTLVNKYNELLNKYKELLNK